MDHQLTFLLTTWQTKGLNVHNNGFVVLYSSHCAININFTVIC